MAESGNFTIIADENIPLVEHTFSSLGAVTRVPGRAISPSHVQNADILLVRSVTPVNESLLGDHTLQFVGSATIGTDHIDRALLRDREIPFAHAPGSNADSVADYVITALLNQAVRTGTALPTRTVGVIGCGNTGSRVARRCEALGCKVLRNDPPLEAARSNAAHRFVSLSTLVQQADIISLHVPLTKTGPHPTYQFVDAEVIDAMQPGTWLVNTSRGDVIVPQAVGAAVTREHLDALLFDVWPNEPTPDSTLVEQAALATPHIAGYAYDGKVRGTQMLYRSLCDVLGETPTWTPTDALAQQAPATWQLSPPDARWPATEAWDALAQQVYPIARDDRRMRDVSSHPPEKQGAGFVDLRRTYPIRREMQRYSVPASAVPAEWYTAVAEGLCMRLG